MYSYYECDLKQFIRVCCFDKKYFILRLNLKATHIIEKLCNLTKSLIKETIYYKENMAT